MRHRADALQLNFSFHHLTLSLFSSPGLFFYVFFSNKLRVKPNLWWLTVSVFFFFSLHDTVLLFCQVCCHLGQLGCSFVCVCFRMVSLLRQGQSSCCVTYWRFSVKAKKQNHPELASFMPVSVKEEVKEKNIAQNMEIFISALTQFFYSVEER